MNMNGPLTGCSAAQPTPQKTMHKSLDALANNIDDLEAICAGLQRDLYASVACQPAPQAAPDSKIGRIEEYTSTPMSNTIDIQATRIKTLALEMRNLSQNLQV